MSSIAKTTPAGRDPFAVEGLDMAFLLDAATAELPAEGDMVTYRDWPEQADSFTRRGIVVKVEHHDGRDILTLRHPEQPSLTWIEWFHQDMEIAPAAA